MSLMNTPATDSNLLTPEQVIVLNTFLRGGADNAASPEKLSADVRHHFTTQRVSEICESLASFGLLVVKAGNCEENEGSNSHFALVQTAEGFSGLVASYLRTLSHQYGRKWPEASGVLFDSAYL